MWIYIKGFVRILSDSNAQIVWLCNNCLTIRVLLGCDAMLFSEYALKIARNVGKHSLSVTAPHHCRHESSAKTLSEQETPLPVLTFLHINSSRYVLCRCQDKESTVSTVCMHVARNYTGSWNMSFVTVMPVFHHECFSLRNGEANNWCQ
jgi:hypothetical protein